MMGEQASSGTAVSHAEDDEAEAASDPAWLFVALLVIVAIGLWLANSPDIEVPIVSLARGIPR